MSAFLGAIIGAWANSLYRDREAKKAQDRERNALLHLIDAEIYGNGTVLAQMAKNPGNVYGNEHSFMFALTEDTWNQTKAKLAYLLPADHLKALINYYNLTRSIRLTMPHAGGELYPETMAEVVDVAQTRGEKARRSGTKYLKELPTYDEPISTS